MKEIILKAQSELSQKLGVSVDNLQFVGMQSITQSNYAYMPLFNILDKKSKLYMTTRAAHVFFKHDKTNDTFSQITFNASLETAED